MANFLCSLRIISVLLVAHVTLFRWHSVAASTNAPTILSFLSSILLQLLYYLTLSTVIIIIIIVL